MLEEFIFQFCRLQERCLPDKGAWSEMMSTTLAKIAPVYLDGSLMDVPDPEAAQKEYLAGGQKVIFWLCRRCIAFFIGFC